MNRTFWTVVTALTAVLALVWSMSNTFYSCSLDRRTRKLQEQSAALYAELSRPMLVVEQLQIDPPKNPVPLKGDLFPPWNDGQAVHGLLQHLREGNGFSEFAAVVVRNYGALPARLGSFRYVIVRDSVGSDTSINAIRVSFPARLVIGPGQSDTLTGSVMAVPESQGDSVWMSVMYAKLHECKVIIFLEYTAHQSSILSQPFRDTTAFKWNDGWKRTTLMSYDRIIKKLQARGK